MSAHPSSRSSDRPDRVIVVGGGLSGIAIALGLALRGVLSRYSNAQLGGAAA